MKLDNNKITLLILLNFSIKGIYLIVVVLIIVYFTGLVWLDITMNTYLANKEAIDNGTTIQKFFWKENIMS